MKTVLLHGKKAAGRVALVDDEDYELVSQYRWHIDDSGNRGPYAQTYMRRDTGRYTTITMHKLITGYRQTDHVNHDGLDNQRANLRPATGSQNNANQRPRTGLTSRYKGICWHRVNRKWQAQIMASPGKRTYLGLFDTEEDAARAYDAAARAAWGMYACLNFREDA